MPLSVNTPEPTSALTTTAGVRLSVLDLAGVSLPGTSGSQSAALPTLPPTALPPGDHIFWRPGGSSHVGLYIGGGQMIHCATYGVGVIIGPVQSGMVFVRY